MQTPLRTYRLSGSERINSSRHYCNNGSLRIFVCMSFLGYTHLRAKGKVSLTPMALLTFFSLADRRLW